MNKDILLVIESLANEKRIDPEEIFQSLEAAMATAVERQNDKDWCVRVSLDRESGAMRAWRTWEVIEDGEEQTEPKKQIYLTTACKENTDIKAGEFLEDELEVAHLGRIAAHKAKQVVLQKVREYEREHIHEKYQEKVGTILSGIVRRRPDRKGAYLDLEGIEAFLPRSKMIPHEIFHPNDRTRALLEEVADREKGPQLILSRSSEQFLYELLCLEIPEIGQGVIGIKAIVRRPGQRSKVAVFTNEPHFDPVGACVGMRGSRVQTISNDLAGERIDVLLWDSDPLKYVINALNSEIVGITVDEAASSMEVVVREEHMTQIIGRNGQNVRLASQLTGWEIDIIDEKTAQEREDTRREESRDLLIEQLQIEPKVADILIREDYTSLEEIGYSPQEEMLQISEFGPQLVERLRARAQDVLLTSAVDESQDANNLSVVPGIDDDIIDALKQQGVHSCTDLANQSVFDIELPQLEVEQTGQLILEARKIIDSMEASQAEEVAAEKPVAAAEEMTITEQDPVAEEPIAAAEEMTITEQDPVAEEPVAAAEEMTIAEQDPVAEEPVAAAEEMTIAEQDPVAEEPVAVAEEMTITEQDPVAEEPVAAAEEMTITEQDPVAEEPVAAAEEMTITEQEPVAEKPAAATKPPAKAKKKASAKKAADDAAAAEEMTITEQEPVAEKPAAATKPPAKAKKKASAKKAADDAGEKPLAEALSEGS